MNLLPKDELKALVEKRHHPSVSIFMPTQRLGREVQQNPIRLKNLLKVAENRLTEETDLNQSEIEALLKPVIALLDDTAFWQHQAEGLAIFLSPEMFHYYHLPFTFEELVVVMERFHIKPLFPLLSRDGRFYILALSQNQIRLFYGTRDSVIPIELPPDMPQSLAEALQYDQVNKQQQFHTKTAGGQGDRDAIFHGQGHKEANRDSDLLRYFQQVDKEIGKSLDDDTAPIVLAGVEYLFPIYKKANTQPQLIIEGITGNPEEQSAEELHQQAWELVQPYFQQSQEKAVAEFQQLLNSSQASEDIRTIVPAAYQGRVDTLFVALGVQQWGKFDLNSDTIQLHGEAHPNDRDLLDSAALHTLLNGGTVYALEPANMPHKVPLAATFRY